jgi:hypothetical protein
MANEKQLAEAAFRSHLRSLDEIEIELKKLDQDASLTPEQRRAERLWLKLERRTLRRWAKKAQQQVAA